MSDWKEQYLAALVARDEVEKDNVHLYRRCAKLADERAELLRKQASVKEQPPAPAPPPSLIGYGIPRFSSPPSLPDNGVVNQLRSDLMKAQQERGDLQVKLDTITQELEAIKARAKTDARRIAQLTQNVQQLMIKVRDREEELRGKAKLVENVQDENVTLNLQLNVAEEKLDKLQKENKDLVDRWMIRKGQEADQMNAQGKFE